MVAGVDDISAVAGIISCTITLLHGCVKGFELLCRARKCEQQMSSLQLMLEFEEQKFHTWAREVGLLDTPPKLRVAIQQTRLVQETLKHLGSLLCDVQKLRRYGLEAEQTTEVMTDIGNDSALSQLDLVRRSELHDSFQTTASIFRSRTSPWHKVKWVAVDEQRFRRLLSDISDFNQKLQYVLEHDSVKVLERRHDALLRNAIMSTTNQQHLDQLSQHTSMFNANRSIAATAKLKGWSIRLGFLERFRTTRPASSGQLVEMRATPVVPQRSQTEIVIDVEEMKLLRRHLRLPSPPKPRECRQLAYYDYKPILVEWRPVNSEAWKLIRPRVNNLASLLKNVDDPSFHSLPCRGYLRYEHAGVYGYVFDLPHNQLRSGSLSSSPTSVANPAVDLPTLPTMRNLLELFTISTRIPSLNVRVSCAINLLETVLQLHTAGWLHKELRSDNILFLTYESDRTWLASDISKDMHVGGYVYARADSPQEFTEPAKSEVRTELYRHSASLGTIRMPYRKSFDVFSVGCVLLELGLWTSLPNILSRNAISRSTTTRYETVYSPSGNRSGSGPSISRLDLEDRLAAQDENVDLMQAKREMLESIYTDSGQMNTLVELLEAQAGRTYAGIVVECLTAATAMSANYSGMSRDEHASALDLEQRSLTRLRQLVEVL